MTPPGSLLAMTIGVGIVGNEQRLAPKPEMSEGSSGVTGEGIAGVLNLCTMGVAHTNVKALQR